MHRIQADVTVTPSVLDRLIDLEPGNPADTAVSRGQSVRSLKNAVRRDLEWLMNTRCNVPDPEESLTEVSHSLYLFGLPDLSTYSMASPDDQAKLYRQILAAIKLFEPRLGNMQLVPLEDTSVGWQRVRVRIDALLLIDPTPEPVSFNTVIELRSGVCRLTGETNAR